MEKAIGFNCLHYGNEPNEGSMEHHGLRDKNYLDTYCTDGIRAELMFPSCWNGQELDSGNHTTHIAYPSEIKYGACPEGYPVRLPVLFYETIYVTAAFRGMDGEFVFANGDPTGYGYHGDFICGWEDGVLQQAIDNTQCTPPRPLGAGTGLQEDCPIFQLQDSYAATQCKMDTPEALQQELINYIPTLPGNVKIQAGPERAVVPGMPFSSIQAANTTTPEATTPETTTPETTTPDTTTPEIAATTVAPDLNSSITPSPSNQNVLITTTTTYMSDHVEVHMVLVEEIVTVTASATKKKRHMHGHGHQGRQARF
jgi:hypothetical protein